MRNFQFNGFFLFDHFILPFVPVYASLFCSHYLLKWIIKSIKLLLKHKLLSKWIIVLDKLWVPDKLSNELSKRNNKFVFLAWTSLFSLIVLFLSLGIPIKSPCDRLEINSNQIKSGSWISIKLIGAQKFLIIILEPWQPLDVGCVRWSKISCLTA